MLHLVPSDDPADRVRQWLRRGGLPLELATKRAFDSAGAETRHSTFYIDPVTQKVREADVYASFKQQGRRAPVQVTYVAECKKPRESVWVIYSSAERRDPHAGPGILHTFRHNLRYVSDLEKYVGMEQGSHFSPSTPAGYHITDLAEKAGPAYHAVEQAVSAADGFGQSLPLSGALGAHDILKLHVVVPVVVTTASLCLIDVDSADLPIQTVDHPQMIRVAMGVSANVRSVWIVPESSLPAFAQQAKEDSGWLKMRNEPFA